MVRRKRSHNLSVARCRRGFTLVELLVVLFIIGVLMALLAPALSGARRQAQNIVCMSNLKSVAFEFRSVLEDPSELRRWNNHPQDPKHFGLTSFIDKTYEAGAYYPSDEMVTHHTRGRKLFFCPSAPATLEVQRGTIAPNPAFQVLREAVQPLANVSYGFNARLYRISRGANPSEAGDKIWYTRLGPSLLTSAFAGRTVLVADYDGRAASDAKVEFGHLLAPAIEEHGNYRAVPDSPRGLQWFPSYRHQSRCNLALIDGSVLPGDETELLQTSSSLINWADARYDGYWQGGQFVGSGSLSVSTLYSVEELSTGIVY